MRKTKATVAWASFPHQESADQAVDRLEDAGFAANSIRLHRERDGTFSVQVHTSERNLERVQGLLNSKQSMFAARQITTGPLKTLVSSPMLVVGFAALAGFALYTLLPRNRRPSVGSIREYPSRFTEIASSAATSVTETVSDIASNLPGSIKDTAQAAKTAVLNVVATTTKPSGSQQPQSQRSR